MKKFMVISVIDGEQCALFFDVYFAARLHALDVKFEMGGRSYMYILNEETEKYEFLTA